MSKYAARINKASFYTFIVRIDNDGAEQVVPDFKCKHYASLRSAELAVARYMKKNGLA